jgi:hypothetical protein
MILGMSPLLFVHVVLSLVGIVSGFVVLAGFLRSERRDGWAAIFLLSTLATSLTGFPLPADRLLPSHIVGIVSLVVLAAAIAGLYLFHLAGRWRWIYVVSSVTALYLNFFVLVVQAFRRIPALHARSRPRNPKRRLRSCRAWSSSHSSFSASPRRAHFAPDRRCRPDRQLPIIHGYFVGGNP